MASPDRNRPNLTRAGIAAVVLGNGFEFYDFTVWSFFAVMIGRAFFPGTTPFHSLLLSVATFGVGFATRPLGGIVLSRRADRVGRGRVMSETIALIAAGTAGIALTPGFDRIGIAAPLLVIAFRLLQGFGLGGEVGPATAYLFETARPGRQGEAVAWQTASQGAAALAAGVIGLSAAFLLPPAWFGAWGWRIAFLLGVAGGPLAWAIRRRLQETLAPAGRTGSARIPPRLVAGGLMMILSGTIPTYVGQYLSTYALTVLHLGARFAFVAPVATGCATLGFALAGGAASDRIGVFPVMLWPRVALLLVSIPVFLLATRVPGLATLVVASVAVAGLNAACIAAGLCALARALPMGGRSTGIGVIYAVGVSVFGGSTQFVVTALLGWTHDSLSPAYYLVAANAVGVWASFLLAPRVAA